MYIFLKILQEIIRLLYLEGTLCVVVVLIIIMIIIIINNNPFYKKTLTPDSFTNAKDFIPPPYLLVLGILLSLLKTYEREGSYSYSLYVVRMTLSLLGC
jgi:hypothetical protein